MSNESFPFKVGTFRCIVVSDGTFAYPHPAQIFFVNAPKERLEQAVRKHNIDPEQWEQYVSPYPSLVINTGQHQVLVDTGAGSLEPTTGKLIPNLQAEGIVPKDIDKVILTHGHPDHIGGNIDSEGKPAFPNARYIMWKDEWDFWISQPNLAELKVDEHIKKLLVTIARNNSHQFKTNSISSTMKRKSFPASELSRRPAIPPATWRLPLPRTASNCCTSPMRCSIKSI